tara:strand:+ start:166 stop:408 length:243 start_codon:yes stop_codon:yes gene_type:complete
MNVEDALKLLEDTVKEDIEQLTPKDRLLFWANLLEFKKAKIQRIPFLVPENDAKIIIEYEDYKTQAHASISQPLAKPKED